MKALYTVVLKVDGEEVQHDISETNPEDAATEVMCRYETEELELIRVEGPFWPDLD